jgi:hypothetical protein
MIKVRACDQTVATVSCVDDAFEALFDFILEAVNKKLCFTGDVIPYDFSVGDDCLSRGEIIIQPDVLH